MKKVFATIFAAALFLMGTQAYAQLSVGAGFMNAQDKTVTVATTIVGNGTSTEKLDLNGGYAGVSYNLAIPAVNGLGLAPGAFLSALFGNNDDTKYTDIAVNIPVNVTFGYNLASDFKLVAFAGPALQIGLIKKSSYTSGGTTTINDYYSEDFYAPRKRFNVLVGAGAGIEVANKYQVMVGFDWGLLKTYDATTTVPVVGSATVTATRPMQIKIGVGYNF